MKGWTLDDLDRLDVDWKDQTTSVDAPARRRLDTERAAGMDEADVQQSVVQWAQAHPDKRLRLLRAYPAGGPTVYAAGLVKGTPDLFLPVPSGPYAMLWLELKHPTRSGADLTPQQHAEMRRLHEAGHAVDVAWTASQARWVLTSYLGDPNAFLSGW